MRGGVCGGEQEYNAIALKHACSMITHLNYVCTQSSGNDVMSNLEVGQSLKHLYNHVGNS